MKQDETTTVSIDADGALIKCAKDAMSTDDCGYVKGAEICGKCGAMAVSVKMVPVDIFNTKGVDMVEMTDEEEDEEMTPKTKKKKKKLEDEMFEEDMSMKKDEMAEDEDEDEDEDAEEDEDEDEDEMTDDVDVDAEDEDDDEVEEKMMYGMTPKKKRRKAMSMDSNEMEDMTEDEDEDMDDEDDEDDEDDTMMADEDMPKKKKAMHGMDEDEDEDEENAEEKMMYGDDDEDDDEKMMSMPERFGMTPKKKRRKDAAAMEDDEDDEDEDVESDVAEGMESMRKNRIKSMGLNLEDFDNGGYICAIERKSYNGGASVCDNCPGGCVSEKGLPGLLHIEGLAEQMFDGEVIDSGYSSDADMFVVDVQVKDGKALEVFVDGTTAEIVGWHKLDEDIFKQKSAVDELVLIDFTEAAEIAVKSIDGHVVAVEPDTFEGYDAYAVEIDGFDGKSYDVFVAMDGEVLGYDKYEPEEAEDIEAEAAEIALKRAFSDEQRTAMAQEGMALPDGSYPIKSEEDLRNAIQAYGRAKDKDAAKRHIMKRAKDMDMVKLIPAQWLVNEGIQAKEKSEETINAEFMKSLVEFQLLELDNDSI